MRAKAAELAPGYLFFFSTVSISSRCSNIRWRSSMPVPCHVAPHTARVVELVFVPAMRGDGSEKDPERMIHLYFSLDGELMACYDPLFGPPDGYITGGRKGGESF